MNRKWVVRRKNEHKYVSGRLSAYLDRQVSDRESERIKTHLETCEQCQRELETLLWTRNLLRQVPVVPVPRSFVVREVDVVPSKTAPRRTLFATQWAAAVVALLFVVVLFGDALTGGLVRSSVWQSDSELIQAEPVAMEQRDYSVVDAPKMAEPDKEIAVEQVPESEKAMAQETEGGVAKGVPSDDEKVRVLAPEAESGEEKVGTTYAVTATLGAEPSVVQLEEAGPPVESTLSPQAKLMTTAPTPAPDESEIVVIPTDPPLPDPRGPAPMRIVFRGVEIGLGVALIGLIVVVIVLRRRMS